MNYQMAKAFILGIVASVGFAVGAQGEPAMGQSAKYFEARGSDGKEYRFSDYAGKFVVLQWYNKDCPFIHKHYDSGNMQKLQDAYAKKGVIWFEVASSAPRQQGYTTPAEAQENRAKVGSKAFATLLDPEGKIGRLYGAKTTPHMFIIDPQGILIYHGAIDDRNSADPADIAGAKNYVAAALDEALAGKPVTVSSTHPYGCSVKYK
jgi:peroxiredoxin